MPLPSLVSLSRSRISAARIPAREQLSRWGSCGRPGSSSCRQWGKRISAQGFSCSCARYLHPLILKAEKTTAQCCSWTSGSSPLIPFLYGKVPLNSVKPVKAKVSANHLELAAQVPVEIWRISVTLLLAFSRQRILLKSKTP